MRRAAGETCQFKRISRRAVYRAPLIAFAVSLLGIGWSSYAFVSLQTGAQPMYWENSSVWFTLHESGDPRLTDLSEEAAVRLAFREWDEVPSSRIAFFEDNQRTRTDWRSDNIHLVMWDMTNESGFFEGAAGLVAITPVDFEPGSGRILDADILFNGKNYTFSTDMGGGTFDVQNVATHEVGHFIGLDHSAVVGATMNPFANTQDTRLRTLEQDDIAGASAIYPSGAAPGWIEGYVKRGGTTPVSGAHVVAENLDGVAASAGLTDNNGFFRIRGLDQGQYVVYAEPLDGPVRDVNFSLQTSGLSINTDFGTTFWGTAGGRSDPANPDRLSVTWGQGVSLGTINARNRAATPMNITAIGQQSYAPGYNGANLTVYGTGLGPSTALTPFRIEVPGPGVFVQNNATFSGGSASVSMDVQSSALPSLRTIRVWNGATGDCAVLTGGFEVRSPAPRMEGVNPTTASPGTVVQVFGQGFQNGARVVLGGEVVLAAGSGGQVSFTVPSTILNGTHSVTVENPDGQFARINAALTVSGSSATTPPTAGSSGGGGGGGGGGGSPVAPAAGGANPPPSYPSSGGGGGGGGGCAINVGAPSGGPPFELALLTIVLLAAVRRRRGA